MISAVILAAGTSSRMGVPKPLVSVAGRPMLDHVLSAVRGSRVKDIVVVLGASADQVRKSASIDGARTIVNEDYTDGMSTSIRAGVRAANPQAEAFLIVLGDEPFVTSSTIDSLLAQRDGSGAKIFIPTYRGRRGNPILVDRELADEMQSITGDQGCRAIFGRHGEQILEVPVDDPGILVDLDTPEQIARAEEAVRTGRSIESLVARTESAPSHLHTPRPGKSPRVDIFQVAHDLRARNEPFVLATVVRVERPSSGRPGFKAIVLPNRELIGWLGGSCAQSVLVAEALRALRDGRPRLMRLTSNVGATPTAEGVVEYSMECESGGAMDIYVEPQIPKPQLLVVGDSPVASALQAMGRVLDYRIVVAAPGAKSSDFPGADQVVLDLDGIPPLLTPDTYAVVATMGKYDEAALGRLTGSRVAYLGLVASRRRASAVLTNLEAAGVDSANRDRIQSPAGLDFAAETPEEIALSILAQITHVRRTSGPHELPVGSALELEVVTHEDVVCGMDVEGDSPIRATHAGQLFLFCSEGCRARFLKTPEAFLT